MSNRVSSPQVYYNNKSATVEALATALQQGILSLFLGAGTSASFGLRTWRGLVEDCLAAANRSPLDSNVTYTGVDLAKRMNAFDVTCTQKGLKPLDVIHDILYETRDPFTMDAMFSNRLLASLAAMMMGSRFGCVRQVVTTNYDNVLERYLAFHGFRTVSITDSHQTVTDADNFIFHPHGYLPYKQNRSFSKSIVLSNESYNIFQNDGQWKTLIMRMMCSTMPLMVGASGNDQMTDFYLDIIQHEQRLDRDTLGFICVGSKEVVGAEAIEQFLTKRMVPIHFNNWSEMPEFLFDICRRARNV